MFFKTLLYFQQKTNIGHQGYLLMGIAQVGIFPKRVGVSVQQD